MKIKMNMITALMITFCLSASIFIEIPISVRALLGDQTNYLIVCPDGWQSDSGIISFAQWRASQVGGGYTVKTVNVSTILGSESLPTLTAIPLKARHIYNMIASSNIGCLSLYYKYGNSYGIFGWYLSGKWNQQPDPPIDCDVFMADGFYGGFTVAFGNSTGIYTQRVMPTQSELHFDGYWGNFAIREDGNGLVYVPDDSSRMYNYICSLPNLQYVLFLGGADLVPSFPAECIGIGITSFSRTDAPYRFATLSTDSDTLDSSKYAVGRIPLDKEGAVDAVLSRTISYKPFVSNTFVGIDGLSGGISGWDSSFEQVCNTAINTLNALNPVGESLTTIKGGCSSDSQLVSYINTEKDCLLFWAHGLPNQCITSSSWEGYPGNLVPSVFSSISFNNPSIIVFDSCSVGDFTQQDCISLGFFTDSYSNAVVVLAGSLPLDANDLTYESSLFTNIPEYDTFGQAFSNNLGQSPWNYVSMQYFGDPALKVYTVTAKPKVQYGEVYADSYLNNTLLTTGVKYSITLPNNTVWLIPFHDLDMTLATGSYSLTSITDYGNQTKQFILGGSQTLWEDFYFSTRDINGDFKANLKDLLLLAHAYGSHPGDMRWNPAADIDGNGVVGLADLVLLATHYGQHDP